MGDFGLLFLFVLLVVSFSSPIDAHNLSLRVENVCIYRRGTLFYCTSFWNLQRKPKGYSSSSHYRINPTAEKSEQVLAIKFVQWDVPPLESLSGSKVYLLRVKLNRGERMNREEKKWLCEAVNSNTYFRTAVPLQGYRFDFFDVLKKYLINQYGQWAEYYAPDRTSLRAYLYGRINQIVEIPKY